MPARADQVEPIPAAPAPIPDITRELADALRGLLNCPELLVPPAFLRPDTRPGA
jgi:hypothetical protein